MDTALTFVLEIYRAAHDTPAEEFHTLSFRLLQQVIPFRSAAWCNNAGIDRHGYVIRGLQTYNEPDSLLEELPHVNNKHSSELGLSPTTIRNFIRHAYRKLGIANKTALASLLHAEGAVSFTASEASRAVPVTDRRGRPA